MAAPSLSLSLRTRFVLLVVAVLAAVALFDAAFYPWRMGNAAREWMAERARSVAAVGVHAAGPAVEFGDATSAGDVVAGIGGAPQVLYAVIYGSDGKVLAGVHEDQASRTAGQPSEEPVVDFEEGRLLIRAPIKTASGAKGGLAIGFSLDRLEAEQRQSVTLGLTAACVVLAIGLLVALWMGTVLVRPIRELTRVTREIVERGDIRHDIQHRSSDEVGALAQSFRDFFAYIGDVARAATSLAQGDLSITVRPRSPNDVLANSVGEIHQSFSRMFTEVQRLREAACRGELTTRADASNYPGAYSEVVRGFNDTLDTVIGPLHVTADYVEQISQGVIPPPIETEWKGELHKLQLGLNRCVAAVNAMLADANRLMDAATRGDLSIRADATRHEGDFKRIVEGVNATLDSVIGPLHVTAEHVEQISKGDIPPRLERGWKGEYRALEVGVNRCIDTVNALLADTNRLVDAATRGELSVRAEAGRHEGDFRRIVEGINQTLDSVTGPVQLAAEYVEQISKGVIPPKITKGWQGEFRALEVGLNRCIEAVNAMLEDTNRLVVAATEGDLAVRAEIERHGGDFRKIVDGFNCALDRIVAPLDRIGHVLKALAARDLTARVEIDCAGDYDSLKKAANTVASQLNSTIRQISGYTTALTSASTTLDGVSQQMLSSAKTTSDQASTVSNSVAEISKSVSAAASVAASAVQLAQSTSENLSRLGQSNEEIDEVIKTINGIAQQTNLLALNAAVEAARAGEAGSGFAVVAQEVKGLANETARATKDISRRIKNIQQDTGAAIEAITRISAVITEIHGIQSRIADAIDRPPGGPTAAAESDRSIVEGISSVAQAAEDTASGAGNTREAAAALGRMATDLEKLLAEFRVEAEAGRRALPAPRPALPA